MCAAIVSGGDALPVFCASEHALDHVATSVGAFAVCRRVIAPLSRWDAGLDAVGGDGIAQDVCIISFATDHCLSRSGKRGQHGGCAFVIADLAFGQEHDDRASELIAYGVQF